MSAKFQKLKEQLYSLEKEDLYSKKVTYQGSGNQLWRLGMRAPQWLKLTLFSAFILSFLLYLGSQIIPEETNTVQAVQNWSQQPDEDLLAGMATWMNDMGYTGLSEEDLIQLRQQGVTATFISRIRDLGLENLTLEEAVQLQQSDVSATFAAMMKELGYSLTVEDLIELRQHNVTAHYTSNLHDLGYTGITKDELIRLKDTGVEIPEVKALIEANNTKPTVSDLIRYHISNQ